MTEDWGVDEDTDLDRLVGQARIVQRVFDQMPLLVCAPDGPDLRFSASTAAYRAFVGRPDVVGTKLRESFAETLGQRGL
jgi:hypothetical protein